MNKQSSKGKSSIIPIVTEYLLLQNFLGAVPCIEHANAWQFLCLKCKKMCWGNSHCKTKVTDPFAIKLDQFFVK